MDTNFIVPYFRRDARDVLGIEAEKILQDGYPTKVMLVHLKIDPRKKKALKTFLSDNSTEGTLATKYFYNEVNILSKCDHPNIMKMDSVGSFPSYHCIVMPYYEEGTLTAVLQEMHQGLIDHYLVQLCSAVKYLHDKGIVHRDIKTDNILITSRNDVVLTDFGYSTLLAPGETHVTYKKGTVIFMSPEQDRETSFNGFKADMYSLGVVLWCMHFKQDVIEETPTAPLLYIVKLNKLLPRIDRTILAGLLDMNPLKRWSIHQLINSLTDPRRFVHRLEQLKEIGSL